MLPALVSGCVEKLVDTGSGPLVDEAADTGLGLAADDPGEPPDSIVHPTRGRIDLTISATGPLLPGADIELAISGVAREAIDSGEVVLTLPTRALMDHVGQQGLPGLSVKAMWDLSAMGMGDTWSGTYTVPGEAAAYYRVMVNAFTHGPDGGQWLFDDATRSAWMFVSETDGRLRRFLEDSISAPVAGPATGWPTGAGPARSPNRPFPWHRDSVYLEFVYTVSEGDDGEEDDFQPAVRTEVWGGRSRRRRGPNTLGMSPSPRTGS